MKGNSSWVATLALFALLAAGGGHWNPFGSGSGSGAVIVGVNGFSLFNWNEWSGSGGDGDHHENTNGKLVFAAGGGTCAGCTVVVGLLEQLVVIHNTTIDQLLNDVCGLFPSEFASICDYFVDKYGEDVIALIEAKETPDAVCNKIELCVDPTCRLFPPPTTTHSQQSSQSHNRPSSISRAPPIIISNNGLKLGEKETPWDWIKALINKLANDHQPIEDIDDDDFSLTPTLRGWSWKGKDCDDINKDIHPGVAVPKGNSAIDWNCNGINGTDPKTNTPYEDLLCGNSGQMGLIVIGDSFGAHFEIPPSYLNASEINGTTYKDLLYVLENEFDWPERSAFTGFEPNSSAIPIDSLYKRLRERNLCNHRDYQNVGVNGARSGAVSGGLDKSIARNQTLDFPVLLIYELIGNDVCNPHPDLDRMTTVEEFRANVLQSLQYLDTILPNGSHIVFIGLADGRVLWDNLYNRTHPIGVTYESVYNFLNCLQISPCWVWMNDNETVRDAGSQRAAELSAVYNELIGNYSFQHFDMVYYDFPFPEIDQVWQSRGGQTWQLIEPVDGFHPNQIAHSLIGAYLWSQLEQYHPEFIGAPNPNNAMILQLFGDQGGY